MKARNLQQQALNLKPVERLQLVQMILESLDQPNPQIEKAWIAESEARYAAYKNGKVKAIPLSVVKKRLRK